MRKKKIVKSEFSFLRKHGFIFKYVHGRTLSTYTFIYLKNPCIKVILIENYQDKYIDLKIRGKKHKVLFFYEWDQLLANEAFDGVDNILPAVRGAYEKHHQPKIRLEAISKLYSEFVKTNLERILTVNGKGA